MDGKPTGFVLLPGLHGSVALFDSFLAAAPAWADCRALELPAQPDQSFSALAETLVTELRSLDGLVIVAESFSGPVAAQVARMLGGAVSLLVLCNPLVRGPLLVVPSRAAAALATTRWLPTWCTAVAMCGGDRSLARAVLREVRALPRQILTSRIAVASSATPADIVPHISVPLLTILGTRDRLLSAAAARTALATVPRHSIVQFAAPHLVIQTGPSAVWSAISAALFPVAS